MNMYEYTYHIPIYCSPHVTHPYPQLELEALRHTEQLLRKPLASSWTSFLGLGMERWWGI